MSIARIAVLAMLRPVPRTRFFVAFLSLALAASAQAHLIFQESFSYPDGSIVGADGSPWVNPRDNDSIV
jgi:hypothetical protein